MKRRINREDYQDWWDSYNWLRALEFLDVNRSFSFNGKKILEIGGKNASMAKWGAKGGGRVICSDILSLDQLDLESIEIMNKLSITYEQINALNIPYENEFDYVMFKSILGGIGRIGHQEKNFQVIKQIFKSLKNGGELLFIENMEGSFIHKIIRNKYGAGKNNWFYPSFYNFISYSRIFCKIKYKTFGIINVNTKNKNHKRVGEFINYSLEKILPAKSRYIFAGVYQK